MAFARCGAVGSAACIRRRVNGAASWTAGCSPSLLTGERLAGRGGAGLGSIQHAGISRASAYAPHIERLACRVLTSHLRATGGSTSPQCGRITGSPYLCACIALQHASPCLTYVLQDAAHDLWQAFLFAPANEWADVQVPISRFVKTWRGKVSASGRCHSGLRHLTRRRTPPGFGKRARDGHITDSQLRHFACRRRRSRGALCCAAQLCEPRPDRAACSSATRTLSAGAPTHTGAQHCRGRQEGFRVMDILSRIARLPYSP